MPDAEGRFENIRGPHNRGCVVRIGSEELDDRTYDPDVRGGFYRDGFCRDQYTESYEFIPYAAVADIITRAGLMSTNVTVRGHSGKLIVDHETWPKARAGLLKRHYREWCAKWGDIANGPARPGGIA